MATTDINSVMEEGEKGGEETCSAMRKRDVKPDKDSRGFSAMDVVRRMRGC